MKNKQLVRTKRLNNINQIYANGIDLENDLSVKQEYTTLDIENNSTEFDSVKIKQIMSSFSVQSAHKSVYIR